MEANSLFGWETIIMGRAARPKRHPRSWDGSSLELVESKLHPPPARPGIVARTRLVDRLLASDAVPVVCVVAPVGYGKTTLLAQWAQRITQPVGWVTLDQRDNDHAVLLTYLGAALDRVEPIDPRVVRGLAGPGASLLGAVPRLAAAIAAMTQPLAMDHEDARALLEGAGVGLDDAAVDELLARTEGWPVGLYLAALAHKASGPRRHAWAGFTGDDRFMADYLRSELLA